MFPPVPSQTLVFGVASPYAWDVVESLWRLGSEPVCVDNVGGADPELPGLTTSAHAAPFVLGLSSALHRPRAAEAALAAGLEEPTTVVDPSATLARTAALGHGVYVNAGVVVGAHARLGCQVNLNRSVSVGHDNELGYAASLGPGAVLAGGVRIGTAAFVGAGATVLPDVSIGSGALVGAGAVVTSDVAAGEVVVGNPARVLRTRESDDLEDLSCPHC